MLQIKGNRLRFTNLRTADGHILEIERDNLSEEELKSIQIKAIKLALENKLPINMQ